MRMAAAGTVAPRARTLTDQDPLSRRWFKERWAAFDYAPHERRYI